MANYTIRIYTQSNYIFDISLRWLLAKMKGVDESELHPFLTGLHRTEAIEYLKSLSWSEVEHKLQFVGIIDSPHNDLLCSSVFDVVDHPLLGYKQKHLRAKRAITKLDINDNEENHEQITDNTD